MQEIIWDSYKLEPRYIRLERANQLASEVTNLRVSEIEEIRYHKEGTNEHIYIFTNDTNHRLNMNRKVYDEIIKHCANQ